MRNSIFLTILTACCFGSLRGMEQPGNPTLQQQRNAGLFGKLASDTLIHLASFCEPQDRCALRCTGHYLNRQLQGPTYPAELTAEEQTFKEQSKAHRIERTQDRNIQDFYQCTQNYYAMIQRHSDIMSKICRAGDLALSISFIPLTMFYSAQHFSEMHAKLLILCSIAPLGVNLKTNYGICRVILKDPLLYGYGLAAHLLNRKEIINKAKKCFASCDEYLHSAHNQNPNQFEELQSILNSLNVPHQSHNNFANNLLNRASNATTMLVGLFKKIFFLHQTLLAAERIHETLCKSLPQ